MKKNVLIVCDYYLPGFKSGGTLRTIVNMVERLQKYYNFKIITRDHDGPNERTQYKNVKIDKWNESSNAEIYYLSRKNINFKNIEKIITQAKPDCVYLNSCFSTLTINILMLKRLKKLKHLPLIIAPEGELDKGSLSLKSFKKKKYLRFSKILGLYRNIIWKAAGEQEIQDIKNIQKKGDPVFLASNMPPREIYPGYEQQNKTEKAKGRVNFVFLSRFDRKKNFNWFIKNIGEIKGDINIDIYAPIEDEDYWKECQNLISELPANIKVERKGLLQYEKVVETLFNYHFFVLPTLGENFGHVFLEALSAGCPLLTSNRTPWRDLEEKNIGWDLPLEKFDLWREKIEKCVEMNNEEYTKMSAASRNYAEQWLNDSGKETATKKVLDFALSAIIRN